MSKKTLDAENVVDIMNHQLSKQKGNEMETTQAQLARTQAEYSKIAGEQVEVKQIGSAIYAFGSELATLRLFRKMPNMRQGYSENLEVFYFSVEV